MYSLDSYFSNKTLKWKTLSVFIQDWQGSKIIDAEWRVSNIVPIVTVEDGSCLYKAISMILICNCQLKYELRLKTVKELNGMFMIMKSLIFIVHGIALKKKY